MDDLKNKPMDHGLGHSMADAIEYLDHGFALFDPAGALLVANAKVKAIFADGRAEDTLAHVLGDLLEAGQKEWVLQRLSALPQKHQSAPAIEIKTKELGYHRHLLRCSTHSDGCVTLALHRVLADPAASERARAVFADAIDNMNFGVAFVNEDQQLVFANKQFRSNCDPNDELLMPGRTMRQVHSEAIRTGLFPLPDGWSATDLLDLMDRLIETNTRDFPVPNSYGASLVGNVYGTELGGRILTIQDLTQDREAEKLLLNAMERLPVGVAIENADGQFTHCNAAYTEPYGLTPSELIAMPGPDRIAYLAPQLASIDNRADFDDIGLAFRDAIHRQRETLEPFEVRFKSGRQYLVERAKTENNGRVLVVTDITALKDAETRNLAAVTDAVQSLDIGVVLFDKDLKIIFGNEKWLKIFGSTETPVRIGDHAMDALRRQVEAGIYRLPDGMSKSDFVLRTTDLIESYAKNEPLVFSDGRHVLASCHRTRLNGILLSFVDITEQRAIEQELERQREMTRQKERLSALGELLASVAHELNNPLSIIVGYAHMLNGQLEDPVKQRRLERILEAANRSTKIVEMFLDMARERPFERVPCRLNDIINSALDIAKRSISEQIQIDLALDDDLGPIAGDSDQLVQVIFNIINNAHQAMESGVTLKRLRVRTRTDASATGAIVEIADSGPGIPSDLRSRIFEPLFSTKDVGEGTGMGLALCHRIVTGHDGYITVGDSDLGGAQFRIHLPLAPS